MRLAHAAAVLVQNGRVDVHVAERLVAMNSSPVITMRATHR
jgi:hypothetical protein